jgi:hypothetical protein
MPRAVPIRGKQRPNRGDTGEGQSQERGHDGWRKVKGENDRVKSGEGLYCPIGKPLNRRAQQQSLDTKNVDATDGNAGSAVALIVPMDLRCTAAFLGTYFYLKPFVGQVRSA